MRAFFAENLFAKKIPGSWKLLSIRANGQQGFAFYRLDETARRYHAFVLQLLAIENGLVVNATTFGYPALFKYFSLPDTI